LRVTQTAEDVVANVTRQSARYVDFGYD
jgi:hypothetical protein